MNILGSESTVPKHKLLVSILVAYACISTVANLFLLLGWFSKQGEGLASSDRRQNGYYYPEDLVAMGLGPWHVTNSMRLTPDKAVLAALHYLESKDPTT